ncbi:MAG: ABC transporter substrate-binding protein [Deltaproteobacteria bacterium]|nr:ABC transporter substrate-binding protein [Deltaproteobacteria bacterium]
MYKFGKQAGRLSIALVMLLLLLSGTGFMASANDDPLVQLQGSVDEILKILQSKELQVPEKKDERKQRVLDVVNTMFDFRSMARSSLGQNWNGLTSEERDLFVDLFADLIEQRYIGKIDAYNDQKVIYKEQRVRNDKARVYTAIVDKDLEIPIDYSLHKSQGKWLIKDMKIENVSLIANYRRDFNSIIRKEKFAGLVEKITAQLEKSEKQN